MDSENVTDQFFLGQIDAKVTSLLEARYRDKQDMKEVLRALTKRLDDVDNRVTDLEKGHWRIAGIATAITGVPTLVLLATYLFKLVG